MLDYAPIEIIEYVSEFSFLADRIYRDYRDYTRPVSELTFDYVYGFGTAYGTLSGLGGSWSNSSGSMSCHIELVSILGTQLFYPYNGTYRAEWEEALGVWELPIYSVQLYEWGGVSVSSFPVAYCAVYTRDMKNHTIPTLMPYSSFYPVSTDDLLMLGLPLNGGTIPDVVLKPDPMNEGIYWLYQFGGILPFTGTLGSLLNFNIPFLNVNFFTFFVGGGFIVYCTFAVVKFFLR